jgi:GNAT superfamily N-acetyltransferase
MGAAPPFRVERLAGHDRRAFECGEPSIDRWFRDMAGQQASRDLAAVHLLIEQRTGQIAGFYTLGNYTVRALELPDAVGKKLPRAMPIPMHLLGRLGVHRAYQGQGIGKMLVNHALRLAEAQARDSASLGVVVHALDARLAAWYQSLGFLPFPEHPLQLVMTMAAIRALPD